MGRDMSKMAQEEAPSSHSPPAHTQTLENKQKQSEPICENYAKKSEVCNHQLLNQERDATEG